MIQFARAVRRNDVVAPAGDLAGLLLHGGEVVAEHLERDGEVRDLGQQRTGKALVIRDSGLAHQRGVGGEAVYVSLTVQPQHGITIGAVREYLYSQAARAALPGAAP